MYSFADLIPWLTFCINHVWKQNTGEIHSFFIKKVLLEQDMIYCRIDTRIWSMIPYMDLMTLRTSRRCCWPCCWSWLNVSVLVWPVLYLLLFCWFGENSLRLSQMGTTYVEYRWICLKRNLQILPRDKTELGKFSYISKIKNLQRII